MMHGHSDEEAQSRSDASSHDMGNIADTEMDVEPSGTSVVENTRQAREKHSDGPAPSPTTPPQPTKKKRTRTLTTPHQSAVLHALLAQSRFPTTAMREEVGRSIGLSARKVQVWFQNQRQKARRPRNQGSAAPARPPQYGGFSNASAPSLVSSTNIPSSLSSDEGHTPFYAAPSAPFIQFSVNREYSSHESIFGSSVSGTSPSSSSGGGHLSGPGVPGTGSFAPRFPPITHSIPPHSAPARTQLDHSPPRIPRDIAHSTSMRQAPSSRDFTLNHPHHLPPLHVPEAGGYRSQGQYLSFPLITSYHDHDHPHLGNFSHSLSRPQSQQRHSFPSPSSSSSSPQTPGTSLFLVPHSRLEPTRDLPRLQIPPLHVPESPHAHSQQQHRRSAVRYSPPRDSVRFSQPSERALLPTPIASGSTPVSSVFAASRDQGSESPPGPASTPSRTKRFDPVREAASECSGSQGTNTPTP